MSASIESLLKEISRKLDRQAKYERYMRVEMFCEKYGYKRKEIDYLRSKHPQIWVGIGGKKVSKNQRTVWRDIQIDLDEFFSLFTSPINKTKGPR